MSTCSCQKVAKKESGKDSKLRQGMAHDISSPPGKKCKNPNCQCSCNKCKLWRKYRDCLELKPPKTKDLVDKQTSCYEEQVLVDMYGKERAAFSGKFDNISSNSLFYTAPKHFKSQKKEPKLPVNAVPTSSRHVTEVKSHVRHSNRYLPASESEEDFLTDPRVPYYLPEKYRDQFKMLVARELESRQAVRACTVKECVVTKQRPKKMKENKVERPVKLPQNVESDCLIVKGAKKKQIARVPSPSSVSSAESCIESATIHIGGPREGPKPASWHPDKNLYAKIANKNSDLSCIVHELPP